MNRLLTKNLWPELKKLATRSKRKKAAVAYFTSGSPITFKKGDTLVVDASDRCIKNGNTTVEALAVADKAEVSVFSCEGLHAKVIIFDSTAFIGSANLSRWSEQYLHEAGLLTNNPLVVSALNAYIEQLSDSSTRLDESFLRHVRALPVKTTPPPRRTFASPTIVQPTLWLVSLGPHVDTMEEKYAPDVEKAEADAEERFEKDANEKWLFWSHRNTHREFKEGDSCILLQFNANKKFVTALQPMPIRLRRRIKARDYFILEAPQHPKRVTSSTFTTWLEAAGVKRRVARRTCRRLSEAEADILGAYWTERLGQ